MPRVTIYKARFSRLYGEDQRLIKKYRRFESEIRRHDRSIFDASLEEHLENIRRRPISKKSEARQVNAVLAYHEWVCESKKLEQENDSAYMPLRQALVSYKDLFHYCKMRVGHLGMKAWSQNKICTAIIRMLEFIAAEMDVDAGMEKAITEMRNNTRALLAKAKREAVRLYKARPSLDELREQGKMLSLIDLANVCQKQQSRVDFLVKNYKRTEQTQKVLGAMLPNETLRLAVISMLLKAPLRKGELEACVIDKKSRQWRFKVSADDRKSGQPINNALSRKELEVFQLLLKTRQLQHEDLAVTNTWRPFQGINATNMLKATTHDIAGVPTNIMNLRTAAESYADKVGRSDVQNALSFAEGHTKRVAKEYYRRNGSTTMMAPWTNHIEGLIHGQDNSDDNGSLAGPNASAIDEEIEKRMELSQQEWKNKIEKKVHDLTVADQKASTTKRKVRVDWSEEEDAELRRLVRIHGKGRWKEMLDASAILKKRYETSQTVEHARACLKRRWKDLSNRSGVKRLADGKVVMDIHRRKKRRASQLPQPAASKERSSSKTKLLIANDDDLYYDVEAIVGYRLKNGQAQYKIKWKGYSKECNSWEPESHLCAGALEDAKAYCKVHKTLKLKRVEKPQK